MEVPKNFKLLEHNHITYDFEAGDLEIPNIYFFARNPNFAVLRKNLRILRNTLFVLSSRNISISQSKLYIWNLQITRFQMMYDMFVFYDFEIFPTSKNGLNSDYFAKIVHEIAKSKYFRDILNDSDSPINSLSDLI